MPINRDSGAQTVLDSLQTIVSSEGGVLEFASLDRSKLTIVYKKDLNESGSDCVPDQEMVLAMMQASLGIYLTHVTNLLLLEEAI